MIDWFTVGAQGLNFLVLVWLMKRFLYQPILSAVDAREQRIAGELADAAAARTEARARRDAYERRRAELDRQRAAIVRAAEETARGEAERIVDAARTRADTLRAERRMAQEQEARELEEAIRGWTAGSVVAVTRRALADLAGADLEERVEAAFLERLESMDAEAVDALGAAIDEAAEPVQLRSAGELSAARRDEVRGAIGRVLGRDVPIVFVTDPALVAGLELRTEGMKVSWSVAEYVAALEEDVQSRLAGRAGAESSGVLGGAA